MADTITTRFRVDGMDCASCAAKIVGATKSLPGVADVSVSVAAGTMQLVHNDVTDLDSVSQRVSQLGYVVSALASSAAGGQPPATDVKAAAHDSAHDREDDGTLKDASESDLHAHDRGGEQSTGAWWTTPKARLTFASGAALVLAWVIGKAIPATMPCAFIAGMLVGLVPIAWRALVAARYGTPFSIEMLMTIAAVGAVMIGAAEEAATVVFLFLVGELLEGVAAGRARASIQSLTRLVPKTTLLEEDGRTREVPAESLPVGSIIVVRPGDRIAADGEIVDGASAVDESSVTGESVPVFKEAGDKVLAGTINGEGVLRLRVTAAAADNTIARVVKLVEEAQESKAPTERFIDRFSRWYTPAVVAVAALVAVVPPLAFGGTWNEWIYKGLALLLIGCPCALVIAVPAAIAAGLSAGARRGLLMKGGTVLEGLGKVTAVAFDKTGTLTAGKPQVTDVVAFGRRSEQDVLRMAAALEAGSNHPLAVAILVKAQEAGIDASVASNAKAIGGKGVSASMDGVEVFLGSSAAANERVRLADDQMKRIANLNQAGKSVSVLLVGKEAAGAVAMRDEARPDAAEGLKTLVDEGIQTIMLTGDNARTAQAIGRQLGIEVRAELLPEDKRRIVGEMRDAGKIVAKVGDGINDAPALAAADIGIAMGGGTDVALETADAAILHGRVGDIARMVDLSKTTMANIWQNITIALGLKAVFLVTTIAGITGLWPAILADTGATVLVTANAMRLLAWRGVQ